VPKKSKSPKKQPVFREYADRFMDNPDFIHRGEVLEFETQKQTSSSKKKVFEARAGSNTNTSFDKQ